MHLTKRQFLTLSLCLFIITGGTSCALFSDQEIPALQEKVFYQDFDKVWRASQIAIQKYPLRINNMDKGLLETSIIRGYKYWKPPYSNKHKSGLRYKLSLQIIRGKAKGKAATKVTVTKTIKVHKNFFAEAESVGSDNYEEQVILYRIARELKLDALLEREQQKMNSNSQ